MANPDEPRRRFAPVPIETTFTSVRKGSKGNKSSSINNANTTTNNPRIGPSAELTPDASPRSLSPAAPELTERRRFAPQLIETSRRARRVGDPGPATRPTDKTDITPYTKNIYTTKPKARRIQDSLEDGHSRPPMPPTRRETEDEAVKEYLLELAAKEAERQIQEAALDAFPNSRAREGGVAHFYFRESSGSENSPENGSPSEDQGQPPSKSRRKSSNLGMNWWHKHMQDHAQSLARERGDDVHEVAVADDDDVSMLSDSELDKMDLSMPPDALWTTSRKASQEFHRDSMDDMPPPPARSAYHTPNTKWSENEAMDDASPVVTEAPEMPFPKSAFKPAQPASQGIGRPFGAFGMKPDSAQLQQLRKFASPPMLGKELTFRTCPSPKLTKMEPNHPFMQHHDDLSNRDVSGKGGLWQGYCCKTGQDEDCLAGHIKGPRIMATPDDPGTPAEPQTAETRSISEEPTSIFSSTASSGRGSGTTVEHRSRNGTTKGLHMLHNVDDRLQQEQLVQASRERDAEREEKIAAEFNDEFVTQVYNYLSLGYPATACIFDDELAKISGVSVADLRRDDEAQMAKGHMLEMRLDDTPEGDRCPRWKALHTYITEWARQHPNLGNLDPLAWGVRERRGSWAI